MAAHADSSGKIFLYFLLGRLHCLDTRALFSDRSRYMINIDSIVNWIQSIHEPYTYMLVFFFITIFTMPPVVLASYLADALVITSTRSISAAGI